MAIRDIFKVSRKTFFDPFKWIDYEGLKDQNQTLYATLKTLFSTDRPLREETFEQAMKRLNLTEQDVQATASRYRLFSIFFLLLSVLVFFYAFYILFGVHSIIGWLLGIGAAGLFLAQAYRYDFWTYQMRQRKLGVTFDEWKRSWLGDKGKTS